MILLGLIAGVLSLAWLLLPVISLVRVVRLEREVATLRTQLERLERLQPAATHLQPDVASPRAVPDPTSGTTDAPLAPASGPIPVLVPLRGSESPQTADVEPPLLPSDLEERIGGRWFQHAGLIVLLLGIAFFLRYAFDRAWLSPAIRVGLGLVVGIAMAAGGVRLARRYRAYGLLFCGGGIAVLYLSVYAGLNLYDLLTTGTAFALLVVITAAAAWLAERNESQAIAVIAVCGGFATPFLVGGSNAQQLTLFSYVGLLILATMYLAQRRQWPWLNVVSLALTALTVISWAARFYDGSGYLRTELFLTAFCAMFLEILRRSWTPAHVRSPLVAALFIAPVSFHLWSVVALAPHGLAYLIYLIAFTVLTVGAGVHYQSSLLRAVAWTAVALPLAGWIEAHHWRDWMVASIAAILGIYAVHVSAQVRSVASGDDLDERDVGLVHANGVGLYIALHQVLSDSVPVATLTVIALLLAAANAAVWTALRRRAPVAALHWVGVAFTLVAIAIWVQLGGPWAVATWATEGAVVYWIAARAARHWLRVGAWALLALAIFRWLQPDLQETTTSFVLVFNARALTGLYVISMIYLAAWIQVTRLRAGSRTLMSEGAILVIAANLLTLLVMSTEILSFWELRGAAEDAYIAGQMMLSAAWVIYAAVVVVIGMRRKYAPVRYFAIVLFGVALLKVFVVDLGTLGGAYRVAGFIVIGLVLLLVSFLYQRAGADPGLERTDG